MQAGASVTVDANAAIPQEIQPNDPRHLGNLTANMTRINAQVSNDTKYDPAPPPRVDKNGKPVIEQFVAQLEASETQLRGERFYAVGAIAAIIVVCILVVAADPKLNSTVKEIRNGYMFLGLSGVMSLITIYIMIRAIKTNELITWYPQLRG